MSAIPPGWGNATSGTLPSGPVLVGWQCPVCGTVWSPFVQCCTMPHTLPAVHTATIPKRQET